MNGVLICNGDRLKPQNAENYEPMTSWRRSDAQEKKLKIPVVYMPRKHDPPEPCGETSPPLLWLTPMMWPAFRNDSGLLRSIGYSNSSWEHRWTCPSAFMLMGWNMAIRRR